MINIKSFVVFMMVSPLEFGHQICNRISTTSGTDEQMELCHRSSQDAIPRVSPVTLKQISKRAAGRGPQPAANAATPRGEVVLNSSAKGACPLMEIARCARRLCFGQFEMDEKTGELRKDGTKIRLQEQPLQILQILLERPGELVSREALRKRVWPTDTFVDFDHGINNAIKRLREALGDIAETPRYIETLPRRGYRFVERVESKEAIQSIAVLPFLSLSADPENEIFADGMCEEIISSLAQIKNLHVTARTSSFSFKGKHVDLRVIGEQLNVRTVLEGSVRKSGNRLRITAQLVNATDGYHLWSERYDREMKDVFAIQEEIAKS